MKVTASILLLAIAGPLSVKADRPEIPVNGAGIPAPARCKSSVNMGCDAVPTISYNTAKAIYLEAKGGGPCTNFGAKCFDLVGGQGQTAVYGCKVEPSKHAVRAFCTVYEADGAIKDFTGTAGQRAGIRQLKLKDGSCQPQFNDYCYVPSYPPTTTIRAGGKKL